MCVLVSKKILTLGAKGDPPPRPKALQLQRMIRYAATLFVQVRPDIQIIVSMKKDMRNLINIQLIHLSLIHNFSVKKNM